MILIYFIRACCTAWRNTIVSIIMILHRMRSLRNLARTSPSTNATFAARFISIGRCWSNTRSGLMVSRRTARGASTFAHCAARSWRPRRASKFIIDRTPVKNRIPVKCAANVLPVTPCWEPTMSHTLENGSIRVTNAARPSHRDLLWLFTSDITRGSDRTFVLSAIRVSSHELSLILIWSLVIEIELSSYDLSSQCEGAYMIENIRNNRFLNLLEKKSVFFFFTIFLIFIILRRFFCKANSQLMLLQIENFSAIGILSSSLFSHTHARQYSKCFHFKKIFLKIVLKSIQTL